MMTVPPPHTEHEAQERFFNRQGQAWSSFVRRVAFRLAKQDDPDVQADATALHRLAGLLSHHGLRLRQEDDHV